MISIFKIKNFKSIDNLELKTLFQEGKLPNNYRNLPNHVAFFNKKEKLTPVLSIYGANASGKSNIIESMYRFIEIIQTGVENTYFPNKLLNPTEDTEFEITFIYKKKEYNYKIIYNKNNINYEHLLCDNLELFLCKNQNIENIVSNSDFYNKKLIKEIYTVECLNEKLQQTTTLLQKLGKQYTNLNVDITSAYIYLTQHIEVCLSNRPCSISSGIKYLANILGNESEALNKILKLIRQFDIDIEKIEIESDKLPFKDYVKNFNDFEITYIDEKSQIVEYNKIFSIHKNLNNEHIKFNFNNEESTGTNILGSIIGMALVVLIKGGILFVDELDRSIHPLILSQLIQLFKDKRYNKTNSQLIFTSHCTDILENEFLRMSEIAIVNKTKKNGTTIKKLSEINGIRNVLNFRKHYLMGEYSGIPFPYL